MSKARFPRRSSVAAVTISGDRRRHVLLCIAVFTGALLAGLGGWREANAANGIQGNASDSGSLIVIESIKDSTWPKTGDC